jgi:hypothetical protein
MKVQMQSEFRMTAAVALFLLYPSTIAFGNFIIPNNNFRIR